MDPLTISATILSVIQLTNNTIRLVEACKDVDDPKVELIQSKLMTQKSVIRRWANRFRAESANGGWDIPPESMEDVDQILRRMMKYWERAQAKMAKIRHAPDGKMTSRVFIYRFWFANGGFQELKDLTDAMDAMNEALMFIAPPLPSYDSDSIPSQAPGQRRPGAELETTQPVSECLGSRAADSNVAVISESQASTVPISKVYTSCALILDLLSREAPEYPHIESLYERLKQWGNSLFQGPASLDIILQDDGPLYATIIRAFIYIAVIEETLLRFICEQGGERQGRLKHHRTAITALLGSDPLSEFSLEIWADIQQFPVEASLAGKTGVQQILDVLNESNTRGKESELMQERQDGSAFGSSSIGAGLGLINYDRTNIESLEEASEVLEKVVNLSLLQADDPPVDVLVSVSDNSDINILDQLSRIIEILFNISPVIRALRRAHFLGLESKELGNSHQLISSASTKMETTQAADSSAADVSEHSLTRHVENILDLASGLEEVLRNDETWAKETGQKVKLYAPIVQKERERLEEFKTAKSASRNPAEMKKLLNTVSGLEQALSETLQDVEVKEKYTGKVRSNPQTDIKLSGHETDKKLAKLVNVFRDSNTALWSRAVN